MKPLKGLSQKQLYMILSFVFFTIVFVSIYSVYYIQNCVNQEVQSEANKSKYHSLSQKIVDLNNEKTDEVRKFIATGNMKYFNNYWKVIRSIEDIQNTIQHTKKNKLMAQESQYLNTAMEDLTLLSYVDTRSMRLMTDALSVNQGQLPEAIKDYVINIEEKKMTDSQKKQQALKLLFDENYITEKNVITNNIMSFRKYVDERLDHKLNEAKAGVQSAIRLQAWLQLFFIVTFFGVLVLLYMYNVKPIRSYTRVLKNIMPNQAHYLDPSGSIETKLLANAFNHLYRSLIRANQAKSDFLSMVSHELRTPLNAIIGYRFLFERTHLTQQQEEYLKIIESSSKHLLLLINQILDYEKIEKGKLNMHSSSFNIRKTLRSVMDMFNYMALEKNIRLVFTCSEQIPEYIQSDSQLINQIVINLLSNAVKFTSEGHVELVLDMVHSEQQDKKKLIIRVSDTGIGIRKEHFKKIFEAFEQASENISLKFGGNGLGLAISKHITESLGGTIALNSVYHKGTIFTVSIPVVTFTEVKGIPDYSIDVNRGRFAGTRILLVEDNLINLKMEKEILEYLGFTVTTASTGKEALHQVDSEIFKFAFLDIRLPDYSGFQIAEYMRKSALNRRICLIALTANIEEVNNQATNYFDALLSKPFEMEQLVALLDRHQPIRILPKEEGRTMLNHKAVLHRLANKRSIYVELLTIFLKEHGRDDQIFYRFFSQCHYEQCSLFIHNLKGISGTIGADRLFSICDKINHKLKIILNKQPGESQKTAINQQFHDDVQTMLNTFTQTKREIERYIKMEQKQMSIKQKEQPANENIQKQSSEIVNLLQDKIRHSDGYCCIFVDEHETALRQSMSLTSYKRLREALYHFDFEKAERILDMGG